MEEQRFSIEHDGEEEHGEHEEEADMLTPMPGMLFFRFIKIVLSPPTIPIGRNDDASMSLIVIREKSEDDGRRKKSVSQE
jgi:hypothetical protein